MLKVNYPGLHNAAVDSSRPFYARPGDFPNEPNPQDEYHRRLPLPGQAFPQIVTWA